MKLIHEQLASIHFDHERWANELAFTQKEIEAYEKRLLKLIEQNAQQEEKRQLLEDMVNYFFELEDTVEFLTAQINDHAKEMRELTHANGELKAMIDIYLPETRQQIDRFRNDYAEIKERFHEFTALQNRT